jgi:hypothetical protein
VPVKDREQDDGGPVLRLLPRGASQSTIVKRDYRSVIAGACYADASCDGALAVVRYDVTALDFKTDLEDSLPKVGVSKGRRVDPQINVGLLTSSTGFPLRVHLFEGNKA